MEEERESNDKVILELDKIKKVSREREKRKRDVAAVRRNESITSSDGG